MSPKPAKDTRCTYPSIETIALNAALTSDYTLIIYTKIANSKHKFQAQLELEVLESLSDVFLLN